MSRGGRSGGRPGDPLHDAHTAVTVLPRAGVPVKVVAQRLGHADVAVTMPVYQYRHRAGRSGGRHLDVVTSSDMVELGGIEPPSIG